MKEHYKTTCFAVLICLFASLGNRAIGSSVLYCNFRAAGYYPDYYAAQLPISQIRYNLLTDIIYFSIQPNADGSLNLSTINQTRQQELIQTAHQNNVKVSLCVGGAGRVEHFSSVTANPVTRAVFIDNLVQYSLTHNYDGIELDWEPVWLEPDKLNYTTLIRELKIAMMPHGLVLSVDVTNDGKEFYRDAIDYIDWLHVMAYEMGTPHSSYNDAIAGLLYWENFGFHRSKIVLGLPFFGRNPTLNTSPPYKQIVETYNPAPEVDQVNDVNGGIIDFNGINTIIAKTQYVVENKFGGIFFWELTNDTTDQTSLLTAAAWAVHTKRPPDFNCDRKYDITDLNHLVTDWLMSICTVDNLWCLRRDLDASGTVDMADFALFSQYWHFFFEGDINKDGYVNLEDAALLSLQWLWTGDAGSIPEDIFQDGLVDLVDFILLVENWLVQ